MKRPPPLPPDPATIQRRLKNISRDTMLIAVILLALGGLMLFFASDGFTRLRSIMLVAGATLILFAPGVWFVFAAIMIRRAAGPVVRWSLLVAGGQFLACLAAISLSTGAGPIFIAPVILLVFFLPALIALLIQLFRARHFIRAYEEARGFHVLTAQAVEESNPAETALPVALPAEVQTDSDRGPK